VCERSIGNRGRGCGNRTQAPLAGTEEKSLEPLTNGLLWGTLACYGLASRRGCLRCVERITNRCRDSIPNCLVLTEKSVEVRFIQDRRCALKSCICIRSVEANVEWLRGSGISGTSILIISADIGYGGERQLSLNRFCRHSGRIRVGRGSGSALRGAALYELWLTAASCQGRKLASTAWSSGVWSLVACLSRYSTCADARFSP
jgi:hypothetical protein